MIKLKVGAVFISDVHYSKNYRKEAFEDFLAEMEKKLPPQIIFFGDIFELLFGKVDYTISQNIKIISKINNLAKKIEIIYLEGNHDFNLKDIFPNIYVFPLQNQPAIFQYQNKTVAISHGDKYSSYLYKIYTSIIRNKIILQIINFLDFNNWISKFAEQKLANKKICKKFDFDYSTRLQYYNANLIIEGHFHQNIQTSNYINLPSFACNQKFLTQIML